MLDQYQSNACAKVSEPVEIEPGSHKYKDKAVTHISAKLAG